MPISYFHRRAVGADLSELLAIHQQQYPGNQLAVLAAVSGGLLVKVAHPDGTPKPEDALTLDEARLEFVVREGL